MYAHDFVKCTTLSESSLYACPLLFFGGFLNTTINTVTQSQPSVIYESVDIMSHGIISRSKYAYDYGNEFGIRIQVSKEEIWR